MIVEPLGDFWTITHDGARLKLMGREPLWVSANAAEAYLEYTTSPKTNVPTDGIRSRRELTAEARKDTINLLAMKYGVTVKEMMARDESNIRTRAS